MRILHYATTRAFVEIRKIDWLIIPFLILVTLFTFLQVCLFEFTNWDDPGNVLNPYLNSPTINVFHFWQAPHMALYIPVTYTVWGALAAIARLDTPRGNIWLNPHVFHSANLLVHIAAVLFAYQLRARL